MIDISNGLLPDIGELNDDNKKSPIVTFSYDNTLDEIDGAMKLFQQRYAGKRGILTVIAYSALLCAAVVAAILNPTLIFAYAAALLCALGLVYSLTEKKRTRHKTIEALSEMNPEDYRATVFDDKIEIETIIKPKVNEINLKLGEEDDKKEDPPLKSIFVFGEDLLNFEENEEALLLILNRRQIYCFPKRCLTPEQEDTLRNFLKNKLEAYS